MTVSAEMIKFKNCMTNRKQSKFQMFMCISSDMQYKYLVPTCILFFVYHFQLDRYTQYTHCTHKYTVLKVLKLRQ